MIDHFSEHYEFDENGLPRRKKKRVARDREHIHFPVTVMDAMQALGFRRTFSDGSPDFTSPFKPGYRFADTNDEARIAADRAYEARRERMENAWRTKGDVKAEDNRDTAPPCTRTLDELREAAEASYAEKCRRLQSAWRNRDGA
jgi:hypothetical protein